ncbi:MAG: tRNA 2-thiouridine(34) synthase MnmA [Bacteroidales bacterium]|jgi:tRNA-specific 2-thiouridylase|nr:tRNA 2-thiouridine(34) synthase MnmA [Bacteroidales bacterium]
MKKILLAMSGGTDSSVAAILLKEQNHQLEGITFRAYDSISKGCMEKETGCCSADAIFEAKKLAESLGFHHNILDIRNDFENTVIKDFIEKYLSGVTPNPCVLCNKEIKWGRLIEECDKLGCDYLATGHYAQIINENNRYFLRKGVDETKDQTYFLWRLSQENLARTIFPLGKLTKSQVRDIARIHGYEKIANKRESQEICFITDDDYKNFLREKIPDIDKNIGKGNFVDINGKVLGEHKGYPYYTVGQRKGLEIAMGYPVYVLDIDSESNVITLGKREDLLSNELWIGDINLMKYDNIDKMTGLTCKIRYNNKGESCTVYQYGDELKVCFDNPVSAVTPGQSAVIYEKNDVVGGGIILKKS